MPSTDRVKARLVLNEDRTGFVRVGGPDPGYRLGCGRCSRKDPTARAPWLGQLLFDVDNSRWVLRAYRHKGRGESGRGESYLRSSKDDHKPTSARCHGCGKLKPLSPQILGRDRDPEARGGEILVD